jgi:hypothetical protein
MRSLALVVPVACIMGGIQAGLIIALGIAKERGLQWPMILVAVLAAALLAAGVLRHYVDIYLHRTVRGISFLFVGLDALGDVFSLLSVIFHGSRLDILGMVIYATELVLWIGIFACGAYYNLAPWLKEVRSGCRSQAPDQAQDTRPGVTIHDLPSSTSVFRTTSGDMDEAVRQRNVSLRTS